MYENYPLSEYNKIQFHLVTNHNRINGNNNVKFARRPPPLEIEKQKKKKKKKSSGQTLSYFTYILLLF